MSSILQKKRAFTLVEILVVIAIIAVLTGIVITSLNQAKIQSRNSERSSDIASILNGVYQYAIDNNNQLPTTITTTATDICQTGATCTGLIDLSVLTNGQKYLTTMPVDPQSTSTVSTNYQISKNANNRIVITATRAENGVSITITR